MRKKPMWYGRLSRLRGQYISSREVVMQDEPTEDDIDSITRPPMCLLWPGDPVRLSDLHLPRCDDIDRVKLLQKVFASKSKHLQRIEGDEPSIFDDESITSLDAVSLRNRKSYEEKELAKRKSRSVKDCESCLPESVRHWILTGEGVPTV